RPPRPALGASIPPGRVSPRLAGGAAGAGANDDTARLALLADLAATERGVAELRKALERIEEGSYGRCADCTAVIPFGRLKIRPMARYCIACQRRHEAR
ncbi:TraR/DksA C4-type zinc finger protein, partial [Microbispora rosea]|uniref:TraR/DksA family transcriptional regulator n=1 Tax=Microbispora rosea TaxID=58117 RepID=UPI003440817A